MLATASENLTAVSKSGTIKTKQVRGKGMESNKENMNKEKRKRGEGLGFIPFFEDYNVYRCIRLVASMEKQRVSSYITKIVENSYTELMNKPLDIINPVAFHTAIKEASKKKGTRGVADYIEYCCSKWVEKEFPKRFMPEIKRGN